MLQRPLGSTGINVSAIGYGAMHLSIDRQLRPSDQESIALIRQMVDDLAITFMDTADAYCIDHTETGHNERLIAAALDGERRQRVLVATKGGCIRPDGRWERNGTPEHLRAACEASLRALAAERIELYQLHAPDPNVPIAESVGAMAALQSEGKIQHIGVSNVSLAQLQAAMTEATVVSVQNQFSVINQREDAELLRFCEGNGITYIPWNPVGGRGKAPELATQSSALEHVALRHGVSAHEIALAWLLRLSPAMLPIPGTRSLQHMAANVRASQIELTPDDMQELSSQAA